MASKQMGETREGIGAATRAARGMTTPPIEDMRQGVLAFLGTFPEVPGAKVAEATINGIGVEWTVPDGVSSDAGVILYLHGGGYVQGAPIGHRRIVTTLAKEAGLRAVSVDYRLAPENPFPAGLDDAVAVFDWLVGEGGVAPSQIIVAGDSAGGGIGAALMLRLRDAGREMPAGAYFISPHLTFAEEGETVTSRQGLDPFFGGGAELLKDLEAQYLPGGNVSDPYASPNGADLSGLPPVLIHVGDYEILLHHATDFCQRASAVGVNAEVVVWAEAFHVFQFYVGIIPEADESLKDAGAWIAERVPASEPV